MHYWLMKSEPDVFGIADLERKGSEPWEGVRNFQARNFMRSMEVGDLVIFYHSNAKPSGAAGVGRIVGPARPDPTQFDPASPYHDSASSTGAPRWDLVDVGYVERFARTISLDELRQHPELAKMLLFRQGRLSVLPLSAAEYTVIVALGRLGPVPQANTSGGKPAAKPKPGSRGQNRRK